MSDNFLRLIPTQPTYVPAHHAQLQARAFLQSLVAPQAEIQIRTSATIKFVDAGGIFEKVICPVCAQEIDVVWWQAAMEQAYQTGFQQLGVITPCCQTPTTLNDLRYDWPLGFARFVLEARNPDIPGLEAQDLKKLEQVLDCPLRVIWAYY